MSLIYLEQPWSHEMSWILNICICLFHQVNLHLLVSVESNAPSPTADLLLCWFYCVVYHSEVYIYKPDYMAYCFVIAVKSTISSTAFVYHTVNVLARWISAWNSCCRWWNLFTWPKGVNDEYEVVLYAKVTKVPLLNYIVIHKQRHAVEMRRY